MDEVVVIYTPHTRCKHSVRVEPTTTVNLGTRQAKLPDLYLTHDLLEALGLEPKRDFRVRITFSVEEA